MFQQKESGLDFRSSTHFSDKAIWWTIFGTCRFYGWCKNVKV